MIKKALIIDGFNKQGYDRDGYNEEGVDKEGFDREGFNSQGYDREGYNKEGFNRRGYNREGFDNKGFDESHIHKDTHTEYDENGYDYEGYDEAGYNREGVNRRGHTRDEQSKIETKQKQRANILLGKATKLATGEMSMEDYIKNSTTSLDDLIVFARRMKMDAEIIKGLNRKAAEYRKLLRPFNLKNYLERTILIIDDEQIRPTEDDVKRAMKYLRENNRLICASTVEETVRSLLRGEIDITVSDKETSPLAQREARLQTLEQEADKIGEIEALIEKQQGTKEK